MNNNQIEFRTGFVSPGSIKYFSIKLLLPPGYILPRSMEEQTPIIYPAARIETDGQNLILKWNKKNMSPGEKYFVFARIVRASSCENSNWCLIVSAIVAIFMLLVGYVLFCFIWINRKRSLVREAILSVLDDEERDVIKILIENNGSLMQNRLVNLTGLSKAKICRILQNLEARNLIIRHRVGGTNRIILKKDL